jgi:hypothetical protein
MANEKVTDNFRIPMAMSMSANGREAKDTEKEFSRAGGIEFQE